MSDHQHCYRTLASFSVLGHSVYIAICSTMLSVVILKYFEPLRHSVIKINIYLSHVSRDAN